MSGSFVWLAFEISGPITLAIIVSVARGWTHEIDRAVLVRMRSRRPQSPGGKPKRLTTAARDLSALGGDMLQIIFLLACMAGLFATDRGETALQLLGIGLGARVALVAFKAAIRRARPDIVDHVVTTYTSSFPSGHTFMATALFLSASLLITTGYSDALKGVAVMFATIISLLIGLTRIVLGIHWPSDVVAGWLAGVTWACGSAILIAALA